MHADGAVHANGTVQIRQYLTKHGLGLEVNMLWRKMRAFSLHQIHIEEKCTRMGISFRGGGYFVPIF